jgi:4-coumarate--CoA ligase
MTTLRATEDQDEEEEEEEIIFRSQLPPSPIPSELSLPEFVLQHVDEYPDAVAIVDASNGRSYTYAQVQRSI